MNPAVDPDISRLRGELDRLDAEIVGTLARRQAIVAEIGRRKQAVGRQLRDYSREKQVLDGVRARALGVGLDPVLAENVLKLLIDASLTTQEQDRLRDGRKGDSQRALVIGGLGQMGRWFCDFLDAQGYAVDVLDVGEAAHEIYPMRAALDDGPLDHAIIVVATTLRATAEVLESLRALRPSGLVIDVASLKTPLLSVLEACAADGMAICSVHPMFGPTANLLAGRHVLFMQVGEHRAALTAARDIFAATSAELVELPLAEHDQLIAYVLGLSHLVNLAFARALADSGAAAQRLAALSSTTFDKQLALSAQVNHEQPALYFEIQTHNAHRDLALDGLTRAIAELRSLVERGDEEGFTALMQSNRHWFDLRGG